MKRIQRRRAKGWRLPEGAVIVDRTMPWGNPFVVGKHGSREECVKLYRYLLQGYFCITSGPGIDILIDYRRWVMAHIHTLRGAIALACWCPLDKSCHADALIDLIEAIEAERWHLAITSRRRYARQRRRQEVLGLTG